MSKWTIALSFAGGLAAAAGGWALWPSEPPQRSSTELMNVLMWDREPVGGPFALTDHDGRPRTDADFRGKLMLIYFGFTFCTDICPTDLQAIGGALDQLGPAGETVQPLFITVDPEKDTPEQLKGHVGLFHPRMIGLTGSPKQIRQVARDYKVYFAKAEPAKRTDPNIDHTGSTFLVGRDGKYLGFFPPGTPADRMAATIRPHLTAAAPQS
jgi:cytochrome oxidase Cu insertion factor (SCO1/SenC/PrrC family)